MKLFVTCWEIGLTQCWLSQSVIKNKLQPHVSDNCLLKKMHFNIPAKLQIFWWIRKFDWQASQAYYTVLWWHIVSVCVYINITYISSLLTIASIRGYEEIYSVLLTCLMAIWNAYPNIYTLQTYFHFSSNAWVQVLCASLVHKHSFTQWPMQRHSLDVQLLSTQESFLTGHLYGMGNVKFLHSTFTISRSMIYASSLPPLF